MFDHWLSKKMEMMKGGQRADQLNRFELGKRPLSDNFSWCYHPTEKHRKVASQIYGGFFKWGYILILVGFSLRKSNQQNSQKNIKTMISICIIPRCRCWNISLQDWVTKLVRIHLRTPPSSEPWCLGTTFTMASWEIPVEKGSKVGFKMGTSSINQGIFHCHRSRLFILFIKTWSHDAVSLKLFPWANYHKSQCSQTASNSNIFFLVCTIR